MHRGTGHVDCRVAMAQLWDFLDQELTEEHMVEIRSHLAGCKSCHPHAAFAEHFLGALRRCRCADPMPDTLRRRVMDTLRNAGLMA
ncbi:MAG: zf-HC2 domain-containing protein [Gemmatimonadaceae bacterium]|nr:zf-HC2 domain-containing protein [Gemmatimonadaceae bacterium]